MIMSIISSVVIIPLLTIGVVSNVIQKNSLGIIFQSIYYTILIIYFIMQSIYYTKNNNTTKRVLKKINKSFLHTFITLIMIYYTLLINEPYKWIIFASIILINILIIIFNSIGIFNMINNILNGILLLTIIFLILYIYGFNFLSFLGLISIILFYTSSLLGEIFNNKIILSFDIISLIIFGIFSILV